MSVLSFSHKLASSYEQALRGAFSQKLDPSLRPSKKRLKKIFKEFPKTYEVIKMYYDLPNIAMPARFWRLMRFLDQNTKYIKLVPLKEAKSLYGGPTNFVGYACSKTELRQHKFDSSNESLPDGLDKKLFKRSGKYTQNCIVFEDGNIATLVHEIQHIRQFQFFSKRIHKCMAKWPKFLTKNYSKKRRIPYKEFITFLIELDARHTEYHALPRSSMVDVFNGYGFSEKFMTGLDAKHGKTKGKYEIFRHENVKSKAAIKWMIHAYGIDHFEPNNLYLQHNVPVRTLFRNPPNLKLTDDRLREKSWWEKFKDAI